MDEMVGGGGGLNVNLYNPTMHLSLHPSIQPIKFRVNCCSEPRSLCRIERNRRIVSNQSMNIILSADNSKEHCSSSRRTYTYTVNIQLPQQFNIDHIECRERGNRQLGSEIK